MYFTRLSLCQDAYLRRGVAWGVVMQAGILMVIYVLTTAVVQIVGFFVSQAVSIQWPAAGLMTFLVYGRIWHGVAACGLTRRGADNKSGSCLRD
jgi:hypothetical protein